MAAETQGGPPPAMKAFVLLSGVALAVFFMFQAVSAVNTRGPAARVEELVGAIDGEVIERPLTAAQTDYQVEVRSGTQVMRAPLSAVLASAAGNAEGGPEPIIFLNFWATWCKPCVRELPSMLELQRTMAGRRFRRVAVSYDEDWNAIDSFFRRVFGGTPRELILVRDPRADAPQEQTLRFAYGTMKLPDSYVIRGDRLLVRFVNERDWTDGAIVEYFKRLSDMK